MTEDTYFLDRELALRESLKKNIIDSNGNIQLCYYDGERYLDEPSNLINIPFDNLLDSLTLVETRLPTKIETAPLDLSENVQQEVLESFNSVLKNVILQKEMLCKYYIEQFQSKNLDFSEKLRVLLIADRNTTVMRYVSENIANTFDKNKFDVNFVLNDEYREIGGFIYFKKIYEINPHIIVTINHLNNSYLNENCYNIIWFQDLLHQLKSKKNIFIRDKDIIFSLTSSVDEALISRGIKKEEIIRQHICTNPNIFFDYKKGEKEEKIVFIGDSFITNIHDSQFLGKREEITSEIITSIENKNINIKDLIEKYSIDEEIMTNFIFPSLLRQYLIIEICKNSKLKVEIYGTNWETIKEVKPYFKGKLNYGKEVADTYNGAKYGLVLNGYKQQRVYEMALCGTIPIFYENEYLFGKNPYHKNSLSFSNIKEFLNIEFIGNIDPSPIAEDGTYSKMIDKFMSIIEKKENIQI